MLDDFGAGHSSLSRLARLPIDKVKVDLHVIGLPPADDARRILTAIIDLALGLGPERIEDDDTWTEVAQIGFASSGLSTVPPLPAEQVEHWLQHPSWFTAAKQT